MNDPLNPTNPTAFPTPPTSNLNSTEPLPAPLVAAPITDPIVTPEPVIPVVAPTPASSPAVTPPVAAPTPIAPAPVAPMVAPTPSSIPPVAPSFSPSSITPPAPTPTPVLATPTASPSVAPTPVTPAVTSTSPATTPAGEPLEGKGAGKYQVRVIADKCIGAASCVAVAPQAFKLNDQQIAVILNSVGNETDDNLLLAAQSCPTLAIEIIDTTTGEKVWPK